MLKVKRKFTEEHKKKISEANKGRIFTEEHKEKIREHIKKQSKINSIKMKELWKNKEYREKISYHHRGEKSNFWAGGVNINPYPPEFNRELKNKIRQRDNFTCCLCGRTEREELEELNRVLAVNHIDFNKNNCNENNLNTLCVRCNVKINREREYWTEYFNKK